MVYSLTREFLDEYSLASNDFTGRCGLSLRRGLFTRPSRTRSTGVNVERGSGASRRASSVDGSWTVDSAGCAEIRAAKGELSHSHRGQ